MRQILVSIPPVGRCPPASQILGKAEFRDLLHDAQLAPQGGLCGDFVAKCQTIVVCTEVEQQPAAAPLLLQLHFTRGAMILNLGDFPPGLHPAFVAYTFCDCNPGESRAQIPLAVEPKAQGRGLQQGVSVTLNRVERATRRIQPDLEQIPAVRALEIEDGGGLQQSEQEQRRTRVHGETSFPAYQKITYKSTVMARSTPAASFIAGALSSSISARTGMFTA